MTDLDEALLPVTGDVISRLVRSHRDFLAFLEARVHDRAVAEDLLQAAFIRALERGGTIRAGESSVAWFFRLLRNALVDHWRRADRRELALEREAREADDASPDPELEAVVCACVAELVPTLKREYSEVLRRVDLDEEPVTVVATALGITANNLGVRLHRARQALRRSLEASCGTCATHGCLDCDCGGPTGRS